MTKRLQIEPTWLSEATILAIHAIHVERYGGAHGVRDEGLLYTLSTKPRHKWMYDESASYGALASVYLTAFAKGHAFFNANESTALACALVFLRLNGVQTRSLETTTSDR